MPREPKLIITGVGRSGTTFVVELLTMLGLDTGFTKEEVLARSSSTYFSRARAGLERSSIKSPFYVIKNPRFCDKLDAIARTNRYDLRCIVCVRELDACAASRIRLGEGPGGLWKTARPEEQRAVLAETQYTLIMALARHEIPHVLLAYPRCLQDVPYAWRRMSPFLGGVTRASFEAAHATIA